MSSKISSKSAIVVGGVSAVAVGALAMALAMGPASADDVANVDGTTVSTDGFGHRGGGEGMEHGRGGHGSGMIRGLEAIDGTVLVSTDTFKAADGTITVIRHQMGEVTAVSDSSITIKSGTIENTYVINADTVVEGFNGETLADIAVGDTVGVRAVVDGDTATAQELHELPALDDVNAEAGEHGPGMGGHHGRGHGGPGMGGPRGMKGDDTLGERISEEKIVEKSDGTIVTIREFEGDVTSVSGSTINFTDANGDAQSFDVPDSVTVERNRAAATVADFVAGDEVHVVVEINGDTETVVAVHGHSEDVDVDASADETNNA